MSLAEIILLGIGLAMDCFAVSLAKGMAAKRLRLMPSLLMAVCFGVFQAGMPVLGYWAGSYFATFVQRFAPWIALGLLSFIGGKMILAHFKDEEEQGVDDYKLLTILVLSVATSIDALATGLIFVGHPSEMMEAVLVIGLCSFLFSISGTLIGVFFGQRFRFPAELVGGIILVGIGLKIFISSFIA